MGNALQSAYLTICGDRGIKSNKSCIKASKMPKWKVLEIHIFVHGYCHADTSI